MVRRAQQAVADFMEAAQQQVPDYVGVPPRDVRDLRVRLIQEELEELRAAQEAASYVDVADALADLVYVVLGTAVSWGIDIEPVFVAVHASNMDKFGPGSYMREDGKWVKPPTWNPPNISMILDRQMD